MNTWTFKGLIAAAILSTLGGCEGGPAQFNLLQAPQGTPQAAPLRQADLARGAVTLVPPDGFCIEPRSLRANFAILARCDTLGDPLGALDAPLGMITISVERIAPDAAPVTESSLRAALRDTEILESQSQDGIVLIRARAPSPAREGLSAVYWRAAGRIGAQQLGLAAYGPEGGRITGPDGARLLVQLAKRTEAQSIAGAVAANSLAKPLPKDSSKDTGAKKGFTSAIAGLFD